MNIPQNLFKSRVTRNACWLISGNIVNKLLSFLVGIWTARYLGPSNYGIINYAAAYTTFFLSLSSLGINSVIVKFFIDYPEQEGETLGTALVLQSISSVISIALIYIITFFVDYGNSVTISVVFLSSLGLFFCVFDTIKFWFQSKLQSKYAAIATTVAYALTSCYKLFLLITQKNVKWFALASSVDYLCIAVILLAVYVRKRGPKLSFSFAKAKSLLSSSCYYILSGLMVSIYVTSDKLMLNQLTNESAVGYYGTAFSICTIWVFVLSSIIESFSPMIMELHSKGELVQYNKKNRQLYAIIFYSSIIVGSFIFIFARIGINLLYGDAYLPAVVPLRIITWYVAFSYLGGARSLWIICEKKQKYMIHLNMGAAITNILLNLLFIPIWEASGAAFATLITQMITIVIFPVLIKDLRPNARLMLDAILLKDLKNKMI